MATQSSLSLWRKGKRRKHYLQMLQQTRLGAETEEEAEAIENEVEDKVEELGAEVVVSPAPTSTTPHCGVSSGGGSHFRDQCEKMPSDCYCKGCETTGHVDKVCLKQQRASANVSEEKKPEDKENGEEKKEEKRNQMPPVGGQDFTRPRGTANLITV